VDLVFLAQPDGACDSLALYAGVPLQLDDEDAVSAGQVQPESLSVSHMLEYRTIRAANVPKPTRAGRHDEHWSLVVFGKLVELGLSLRERGAAIDAEVGNFSLVQVLG